MLFIAPMLESIIPWIYVARRRSSYSLALLTSLGLIIHFGFILIAILYDKDSITLSYTIPCMIIAMILFITTVAEFLTTALSDPGAVPPLEIMTKAPLMSLQQLNYDYQREIPDQVGETEESYAIYINTYLDLEMAKSLKNDVRFCSSCNIYRLQGSECGYCIRGFDHHCAVVNCIVLIRPFVKDIFELNLRTPVISFILAIYNCVDYVILNSSMNSIPTPWIIACSIIAVIVLSFFLARNALPRMCQIWIGTAALGGIAVVYLFFAISRRLPWASSGLVLASIVGLVAVIPNMFLHCWLLWEGKTYKDSIRKNPGQKSSGCLPVLFGPLGTISYAKLLLLERPLRE